MEAGKERNEFRNFETWAVYHRLANGGGSQRYWTEAAREANEEAAGCWEVGERTWEPLEAPIYFLANRLRSEVNEETPEFGSGLDGDLLKSALSRVYWYEVAAAFLEAEFWDRAF